MHTKQPALAAAVWSYNNIMPLPGAGTHFTLLSSLDFMTTRSIHSCQYSDILINLIEYILRCQTLIGQQWVDSTSRPQRRELVDNAYGR